MKYILLLLLSLYFKYSFSQTYSKVIPDSEIISVINFDSSQTFKIINRKIIPLRAENFYYKDSADLANKNSSGGFLFRHYKYPNGRVLTYHVDTIFSKADMEFFHHQLKNLKKRVFWKNSIPNTMLVDKIELDSTNNTSEVLFSYSIPLFSLDRKKAIIIQGFFCGPLCGGGSYYIYQKDLKERWQLIRKIFLWGE